MTVKNKVGNRRAFRYENTVDTSNGTSTKGTAFYDYSTYETMNGGDSKGWRRAIASGAVVFNNATATRGDLKLESGSASHVTDYKDWNGVSMYVKGTRTYKVTGHLGVLPPVSTPGGGTGSAINQAKSKFVSRVRSEQTRFQSGIALGELAETVKLIRHPATAISNYLNRYAADLKKSRPRMLRLSRSDTRKGALRSLNKQLADKWLEVSFGIKPLLSDVKSLAEAVAEQSLKSNNSRVPVRGSGSEESLVSVINRGGSFGPVTWQYTNRIYDRITAHVYGAMVSKTERSQPTISNFGLDLSNWVPTVYNLIPYTFLLDYFVNVDDIVDAATLRTSDLAYWGISTKGSRTCVIADVVETTNKGKLPPLTIGYDYVSSSVNLGNSSWKAEQFSRFQSPSLVPSLRFKIPGTGQKYGNMIALAASRFRPLQPFFTKNYLRKKDR